MRTDLSGFAATAIAVAIGIVVPSVASAAAPDPLDTWSASTILGSGAIAALPVSFENGLFYMPSGTLAGISGTVRSSRDGITWSALSGYLRLTSPTSFGYANNTYVFGTQNGTIYRSADGMGWTPSGTTVNGALSALVYVNGQWVFSGGRGVVTSRDLATWTATQIPGQRVNSTGIAFANGLFVVTSNDGIATSTDATTWTRRVSGVPLRAIANAKGMFVAVGAAGTVETSTDGLTWTRHAAPAGAPTFTSVVYGDGGWVTVGTGGSASVYSSPDGATWTPHAFAASMAAQSVAFGNGVYVVSAFDTGGEILSYASGSYATLSLTNVHTVLTNPGPTALPAAPAGPVIVHKP